jgi:hypothetical protein
MSPPIPLKIKPLFYEKPVRVDTLELEAQAPREIYLEGVDFPLVLVKQVFTNEDGDIGIRYLVSSDTRWTRLDPCKKKGLG